MNEIGFWDYTCPQHGSLEHYRNQDWDQLLDDCAAGGFNSLVLGIKWLTTGYRSKFPWLDQDPGNAAIASDNATVHYALEQARRRGIRTWLLVVASIYDVEKFGFMPAHNGPKGSTGSHSYDLDQPLVQERILALFDEIATLFGPQADGLVVELEFCDYDAPHRIEPYNRWAAANGRPDFAALRAAPMDPRSYPLDHWRDYTTSRRIETLRAIERVVRPRGFAGKLSSLVELHNAPQAVVCNANLQTLQSALPHWAVVTYDSIYDRRVNRLATMDFCIEQPRALGLGVCYLTRGVMTWTWRPDAPPINLPRQWRMSLEDAARHQPDVLWFMGSDARRDGMVCSDQKMPAWGYPDGRTARLALMQMARDMGLGK